MYSSLDTDQTRMSTTALRDRTHLVSQKMTRHVRVQLDRVTVRIWSLKKALDTYGYSWIA